MSETILRSISTNLLTLEQIHTLDPQAIIAIPRLAIVSNLLHTPDTICMTDPDTGFRYFRAKALTLRRIKERLGALEAGEVALLELLLCGGEEEMGMGKGKGVLSESGNGERMDSGLELNGSDGNNEGDERGENGDGKKERGPKSTDGSVGSGEELDETNEDETLPHFFISRIGSGSGTLLPIKSPFFPPTTSSPLTSFSDDIEIDESNINKDEGDDDDDGNSFSTAPLPPPTPTSLRTNQLNPHTAATASPTLTALFRDICSVADDLQGGPRAKEFVGIMHKVFSMHAGGEEDGEGGVGGAQKIVKKGRGKR